MWWSSDKAQPDVRLKHIPWALKSCSGHKDKRGFMALNRDNNFFISSFLNAFAMNSTDRITSSTDRHKGECDLEEVEQTSAGIITTHDPTTPWPPTQLSLSQPQPHHTLVYINFHHCQDHTYITSSPGSNLTPNHNFISNYITSITTHSHLHIH